MNEQLAKIKKKVKKPSNFCVILLDDDCTTQEFVIEVLEIFFYKTLNEATDLMLKIHNEGEAVCGIYSYDIAQTKVEQVISYSRDNEYPLMCIVREVK